MPVTASVIGYVTGANHYTIATNTIPTSLKLIHKAVATGQQYKCFVPPAPLRCEQLSWEVAPADPLD